MHKRNLGIDLLRGVCILLVILLHLNIHFGYTQSFLKEELPRKLFSNLFWNGYYGVVIFFTLSGYLITNSIIKKFGSLPQINIKRFYWLRFSRIIPLLALLLLILSLLHILEVRGFIIDKERASLSYSIFAALTFHINWYEIWVGYLPANWDILWSISIEETFYIFFPLICLFLKNERQFVIFLIIFLFISPFARTSLYPANELGDRNHLAYLDSIALGCMAAIFARHISITRQMGLIFLILGWFLILPVFLYRGYLYKSGIVNLGLNITMLSLGISLIVLWMHRNHEAGQEKNRFIYRWLKHMGIYSYEIYLSHMFVIIWGRQLYSYFELGEHWLVPYSLLLIILSYLLGQVIFKHFSEPINLRLRKKYQL